MYRFHKRNASSDLRNVHFGIPVQKFHESSFSIEVYRVTHND